MRILTLNTDYPDFLDWLYSKHSSLHKHSYEAQMKARHDSLFGVADFYSTNLQKLGHEAIDIHANNDFMQRAWAREHGLRVDEPSTAVLEWRATLSKVRRKASQTALRHLKPLLRPLLRSLNGPDRWLDDILAAQVRYYRPDVLLNQAMDDIDSSLVGEMKPYVRLLVGQIAAPLPENEDFNCYDLIISSLPNFVEHFRRLGIPSELSRFAFEPSILSELEARGHEFAASFVGSLSPSHQTRVHLLEHLCSCTELKIWGNGVERLTQGSSIRRRYVKPAWGREMYSILRSSKVTLNHHIGIAGAYANNMRLFEATGVGTMLVTDWKQNLPEIFEPGKEVVAYRSPEECAELVQYYLAHDDERAAIARAGQTRTLREHTYQHRMQELECVIEKYL